MRSIVESLKEKALIICCCAIFFIFRLHRMHEMLTIVTDVCGVSVSVCHAA